MEEYIKLILYAYPLLRKSGAEYEERISNKGVLSYRSKVSTEKLLEEIAELIITQRKLFWLKEKIDEAVLGLTETEKSLVKIRYFGDKKEAKRWREEQTEKGCCSERKYFRMQERVGKKLGALLRFAGVSEKLFFEEYDGIDIFKRTKAILKKKEEKESLPKEKAYSSQS